MEVVRSSDDKRIDVVIRNQLRFAAGCVRESELVPAVLRLQPRSAANTDEFNAVRRLDCGQQNAIGKATCTQYAYLQLHGLVGASESASYAQLHSRLQFEVAGVTEKHSQVRLA